MSASSVFVVSSPRGIEQVFARREDAERFAGDTPGRSVVRQPVRQSFDDAVVIVDRHVVVAGGRIVKDDTREVHRFVDNPWDLPEPADVEWFEERSESLWHIRGFGVDRDVLDTKVRSVIDQLR